MSPLFIFFYFTFLARSPFNVSIQNQQQLNNSNHGPVYKDLFFQISF